jgi:hypothetical protein
LHEIIELNHLPEVASGDAVWKSAVALSLVTFTSMVVACVAAAIGDRENEAVLTA